MDFRLRNLNNMDRFEFALTSILSHIFTNLPLTLKKKYPNKIWQIQGGKHIFQNLFKKMKAELIIFASLMCSLELKNQIMLSLPMFIANLV